jgi:polysaccharide deacetylase family protein (PEP-CTERM system associated)
MISFTIDLEDPTGRYEPDGRYVAMTRRILAMCDEFRRPATFFVVGRVAQAVPDLVKEIASRGHEVAYHSHAHVPLTQEEPDRFRRESREDKDRLAQLAGKNVAGFRAPCFSLTPKSVWTLDVLAELNFLYSSSIMPTGISRFGFKNTPRTPFLWPNGMIELPLPVGSLGSLRVPYLGGIYLYAMPWKLTKHWIARAGKDEILWTYTHPYDFDREEKFKPIPDTPLWISLVLWLARRKAEAKIWKILGLGQGVTLGQRVTERGLDRLPSYNFSG